MTRAETRPDQIGTPAVPGQEWARFLREVARVLKPGGRFALLDSTVPRGDVGDLFNRFELMRDPSLPIAEWLALLAAAGLTVDAVESFTKRHGFASWAARSRVPEGDLPALAKLLLDADDEVSDLFRVERDGETLSAFTDEKTRFLAIRPDS